jgi:D-psicose/D-tagatose/L-ribulose 3-epimerase
MKFGVCTSIDNAAAAKAAGWDYVEASVQSLLQGLKPDAEWDGRQQVAQSALPVPAANLLVPGSLKITGPEADLNALRAYMSNVLARAGHLGMKTLVFGSGGARNVPEGFDREQARRQITEFARMAADIAGRHGVTIVIEPLGSKECNIISSVAEAMTYVNEVKHAHLQCLVDSYHFWVEDEPLENLRAAMPWIKHVHLADRDGRLPPGESGTADYRPFFKVLKDGGYDGLISVEASKFDIPSMGPRVLEYIKEQWNNC